MINLKTDWTQYDVMKPSDFNTICSAVNERGAMIAALEQENETLRKKLAAKADLSEAGAQNWDSGNMAFLQNTSLAIYLSPEGSDSEGDGTQAKPWQTFERVYRQICRTTGSGVISVCFEDGTYELDKTYTFHGVARYLRFCSTSEDHTKVKLNIAHGDHGFIFYACPEVLFHGLTLNVVGPRTEAYRYTIIANSSSLEFRYGAILSDVPQTVSGTTAILYSMGASGLLHDNIISNHDIAIRADNGSTVFARNNTGTGNSIALRVAGGIIMRNGTIPEAATPESAIYGGQIFK